MLSASRCRKKLFRNIKYEIILEVFKTNHLKVYEKEYWILSCYERIIREDHQNLSFPQKRNILQKTKCFQEEMGKFLVKKGVLVKAGIPPSINKETVRRVLRKTDLKWTHFQRKGIISENDLKLRLKFAWKIYLKSATCNNEIWNHQKACGTRDSGSQFN